MTIKIMITAALVALLAGCASAPAPEVDNQARAGYGEVRGGLPSPGAERQHREDEGPATTGGKSDD